MVKQPVGPYTFGEEYNQIQEKSRALELSYNKKKNQFTQEQVNRTKELAGLYPSAQSGLISSAVLKGLNNKEFEALLKLQYQAVPKSQPVFPNQTGNDVYKSAMFNSTFGKVFNAYQFMIMVKDAHEHMDMGRVAFAIGNPSFSRRVCFKMLECTARGHMGGYGSTLNLDEVQEIGKDVFYISELPYQEKHLFSDAQGAHDFTFKQWNAELERSV